MKVIKTFKQSISFKVIEQSNSFLLAIAVLQYFPFHRATLLPEMELWQFAPAQLGTESVLDMGFPKSRGEGLVAGKAFAPRGKPARALEVCFGLGPIEKKLYVFGNRSWRHDLFGTNITEPAKFKVMDIDYSRAFGGEGFVKNPLGKGYTRLVDQEGQEVLPLPNIEHPDHLVVSTLDQPDPVGFGPLDISWPQRQAKAGTYDGKWFRERFPGLADDMDPTFFNEAPPDQWIKGFFSGDEPFYFHNMHPEKPFLRGRLPGFRARVFINQLIEDSETLSEIKMNPETIWFFPHEEKGILIHRGVAPVRTDDAEDVLHLMAAYESIEEEPASFEHYRQEFETRIDEETGYLYALYEPGLAPACELEAQAAEDAEKKSIFDDDGLLIKHQKKRMEMEKIRAEAEKEKALAKARVTIEEHGLDPNSFMPPPGPPEKVPELPEIDPDHLDPKAIIELIKKTEEESRNFEEKIKTEVMARKQEAEMKIKEFCQLTGQDHEEILARIQPPTPKRPVLSADETISQLKQNKEMVEKQVLDMSAHFGLDPETLLAQAKTEADEKTAPVINMLEEIRKFNPDDPGLIDQLRQAEEMSKESYRRSAHHFPKLEKPSPEGAARLKEDFMALLAENKSPAGMDWAGLDLSGLDLKGIDLRDAYLEGADFSGADLHGADLSGSILAWADLSGAILHHTKMHKTCLAGSNLTKAKILEADLTEAVLAEADLSETDLTGSDVTNVDPTKAILDRTNFSNTFLSEGLFMEVDFSGVNFSRADLSQTIFINCKLDGADFTGARAPGAVFLSSSCQRTIFRNADLKKACFLDNAQMAEADFSGAVLDQANLMEADLTGATLVETGLNEANLMKTRLKKADLRAIVAKQANLMKADLQEARLVGANLMEANLKGARLLGTDLRLASLYGAEVMRAVFGRTDLRGANLKMTKIANWRPDDQGRTDSKY